MLASANAAIEALMFMRDLYQAVHPGGLPALKWQEYANDKVSMMWGLPTTLKLVQTQSPDMATNTRIYAPRRSSTSNPVTLAFIDGYRITINAKDPQMAWNFIEFMSRRASILGMVSQGLDYMPLCTDVIGAAAKYMEPYLPFYDLMPQAMQGIIGPFTSDIRKTIANFLTPVLKGTVAPSQAVENMDLALENFVRSLNKK